MNEITLLQQASSQMIQEILEQIMSNVERISVAASGEVVHISARFNQSSKFAEIEINRIGAASSIRVLMKCGPPYEGNFIGYHRLLTCAHYETITNVLVSHLAINSEKLDPE